MGGEEGCGGDWESVSVITKVETQVSLFWKAAGNYGLEDFRSQTYTDSLVDDHVSVVATHPTIL